MSQSDTELHGYDLTGAHEIDKNNRPRRCKMYKCKTWLSAYNKNRYCFAHTWDGAKRDDRLGIKKRRSTHEEKEASGLNLKQENESKVKVPATPRKARKSQKDKKKRGCP